MGAAWLPPLRSQWDTESYWIYLQKLNVRTILDTRHSQRHEHQTAQVARELDSSGVRRCSRAGVVP